MSLGTLTDRLRSVVNSDRQAMAPPVAAPIGLGLEAALGGAWCAHDGGRCFVVERREDPDAWHGGVQVGALAEALRSVARDAPLLANGAAARPPFVFFDLETTGLSGGAGTYAFLVGCAWFDDTGALISRQHVLQRAADERAMLQAVGERLRSAGTLVSFNGKSFDAPLLESRFMYHRLVWSGGETPHIDVLHPARRFWRAESSSGETTSCSLGTLEHQVLGVRRPDDVPGFEVPERYFRFVRSGDAGPLAGVLEHNRMDLLSLAGLTVRLLRLVNQGAREARDAREALALGRIYDRAGLPTRAEDAYAFSLTLDGPGESKWVRAALRMDALRGLAHLARRSRRYDEAARRWREVLEQPGLSRAVAREAAEALAIHHEHRMRDLEAARAFALRTLDVGAISARNDAVRHRLARLERKLVAAQAGPRLELGD